MQKRPILVACTALALVFSLNSCAWMSNTMSRAKERIAAMRDSMKQKSADADVANADAQQSAQVAAAGGTSVGGHGHHVVTGGGKPVGNAYGECVNTGLDGSAHGGACGDTAAVAQDDVPAPVVEATPLAQEPALTANEMAASESAMRPAQEPMPQASAQAAPGEPQPIAMGQPEVVAPPPPPAAPPVVGQAMPKPPAPAEKISLSADALFPFAQYSESSMLPAGRAKLDEIAARIKQMPAGGLQRLMITGHADRLGRMDRNQRLSERRAQTVRNYLAKQGVDPSLMSANGKGETDPIVYCKGNKRTAKLKSCLAPNRRVDVAFFGDSDKIAHSR